MLELIQHCHGAVRAYPDEATATQIRNARTDEYDTLQSTSRSRGGLGPNRPPKQPGPSLNVTQITHHGRQVYGEQIFYVTIFNLPSDKAHRSSRHKSRREQGHYLLHLNFFRLAICFYRMPHRSHILYSRCKVSRAQQMVRYSILVGV